jgi:hypothetical protein
MAATVLALIGSPDPKVVPAPLAGDGVGAGAGAGSAGPGPGLRAAECGTGPATADGSTGLAGTVAVARLAPGRPFVTPAIALLPGGAVTVALA